MGLHITLFALNSQYVHASLAPWCLKAGIAAYASLPHDVRIIEGTVNEPQEVVLERVIGTKPDLLGISCYIWNITAVRAMLPALRAALPGATIVLGGPEVSYRPADILQECPQVDAVLCGEGEQPFARLADALAQKDRWGDVPGLCWRAEEGLHIAEPFVHPQMPASPYGPGYWDAVRGRIAYMEASRGCPYSCAFCLSGRDGGVRFLPPKQAVQTALTLAQAGPRTVKFVDRTFNAHRAWAKDILRGLRDAALAADRPLGTFHFEIAGDLLDEETIGIVRASPPGLFQFEIGLQSMEEATLRAVRRVTDMQQLERMVRGLIACGTAHVHLDLIAGLPGEDLPAFIRGFDEAYALRPHALQLGFLKLLHGSAMREQPEDYPCEYDPLPPYQVRSTPWMRAQDLQVLSTAEHALDKLHNSGRFPRTLSWLVEEQGLSPFALFSGLGRSIQREEAGAGSLSLDALTDLVMRELPAQFPLEQDPLYDLLLLDRLSAVRSHVLPESLKAGQPRRQEAARALERLAPRPPGSMRAMAITRCLPRQVLYCDYEARDPVTGLYEVQRLPLDALGPLASVKSV